MTTIPLGPERPRGKNCLIELDQSCMVTIYLGLFTEMKLSSPLLGSVVQRFSFNKSVAAVLCQDSWNCAHIP